MTEAQPAVVVPEAEFTEVEDTMPSSAIASRAVAPVGSTTATTGFFDLPFEIRHMIYTLHFSQVNSVIGLPTDAPVARKRMLRGTANPLALLYTCHQVHEELKASWPKLVHFKFTGSVLSPNLRVMLNKLGPLKPDIIGLLRHLTLTSATVGIGRPSGPYARLLASDTMSLLPELQLSTLTFDFRRMTIDDGGCGWAAAWSCLNDLVDAPQGFQELRLLPSWQMAYYYYTTGNPSEHSCQKLLSLDSRIKTLDGHDSGALARVIRTTLPFNGRLSASTPQERDELYGLLGLQKENKLSKWTGQTMHMLVIVRRGSEAKYKTEARPVQCEYGEDLAQWIGKPARTAVSWQDVMEFEASQAL